MTDSFPAINAEQLTKAAAGVLSAIDGDTIEENWPNNGRFQHLCQTDKTEFKQPKQSSLEMLENLSSSVCSELDKLNNLDLQKPVRHNSPNLNVCGRVKKPDGSVHPGAKKYSTRKNYKLLPPLIPTQLKTSHRKPMPELVCSKQLVTLSNHANFHSPEKLKSMPVRLARYTTNYLLIRTTAPLQHSDLSKPQTVMRQPIVYSGTNISPAGNVSSVTSAVTSSPELGFISSNSLPLAPRLIQQSNLATLVVACGGKPTIQPVLRPGGEPTIQPVLRPGGEPTIQPVLRPGGEPTIQPVLRPGGEPTIQPVLRPGGEPTIQPVLRPGGEPTIQPVLRPGGEPTIQPVLRPGGEPTIQPVLRPGGEPTIQPVLRSGGEPTIQPVLRPGGEPTIQPVLKPGSKPTIQPVLKPVIRLPFTSPSNLPSAKLQNDNALTSVKCNADISASSTVATITCKDVTQSGHQLFSPLKINLSKPGLYTGCDGVFRSELHVIPTPASSATGSFSKVPEMTVACNLNVFHMSSTMPITSCSKSLSQVKSSPLSCQLSSSASTSSSSSTSTSSSSSTESTVHNVDTLAKHQSCLRVLLQKKAYTSAQLPVQTSSTSGLSVVQEPKLKCAEKSLQLFKSPLSCNVSKLFELTTKSPVNTLNKNCTDIVNIDNSETVYVKPFNYPKLSVKVSQAGNQLYTSNYSKTIDMFGTSLSYVTCKPVTAGTGLLTAQLNEVRPATAGAGLLTAQLNEVRPATAGAGLLTAQLNEVRPATAGTGLLTAQLNEVRPATAGTGLLTAQLNEVRPVTAGTGLLTAQLNEVRPATAGAGLLTAQLNEVRPVIAGAGLLTAQLNDVKSPSQNLTSIPGISSSSNIVPGGSNSSGIDHQFEQVKESFLNLMKSPTSKVHPAVPVLSVSSQTFVTSSHPCTGIRCNSVKHLHPNTVVSSVHETFHSNSLPVRVVLSSAAATLPSTTGKSQTDITLKSLLTSTEPDKTEQRSKNTLLLPSTICINRSNNSTVPQSTVGGSDALKSSVKEFREEESTTLSAAAAMVSLSETNISLAKPNQVSANGSDFTSIVPLASTPQFLISHENRPKLVISQAGIMHLQDLLRKQGISEGYFVITSPRTAVSTLSKSKQDSLHIMKSDFNESQTKKDLCVKKNSYSTSVKGTSSSDYLNTCSSLSTSSEQPTSKENLSTKDVKGNKENSRVRVSPHSAKVESICHDSYESDSSLESHSSCGALVIETGEDEDRQSSTMSLEKDESSLRNQLSESGEGIFQNDDCNSVIPKKVSKLEESSWDASSDPHIAQSPLSLSDLIRQQQKPEHLQQVPSAGAGDDFTFAIPLCPTSAYCAAHSHGNVEMSSGFQHNLFAANSLFSGDIPYEAGSQSCALDSHGHIAEIPNNSSPKLLSRPMSVASPKSPLSVNSNNNPDHSTTLNPPMTPNTMLINLLNRVPTPLLTNHQDLLSVPTSQESTINDNDTALENFEIIQNKQEGSIFPGGKNMSYSDVSEHNPPSLISSAESENTSLVYNQETGDASSSSRKFVHNTLELLSTNYDSEPIVSDEHHSHVNNFSEAIFSQCRGQESSFGFSENYVDDAKSHNNCQHCHCKSCSGTLVFTVNLDSNSPENAVKISHSCNEGKSVEGILNTYAHSSMSLQKTNNNGEPSGMQVNLVPFKSTETDILRHLILNTSSTSFHAVPPIEQRLVSTPLTFDLSNNHISQDSHQYECQVESFLDSRNQRKNMTQSTTYPPTDDQFLPLESHSHSQSISSFKNLKPSFTSASYQTTGAFDGTDKPYSDNSTMVNSASSSSYTDKPYSDNSTMVNSASSSSYILHTSVPSFNINNVSKNNMPVDDQPFLESDERLQHLNEFRSDGQDDTLFYQHPHDTQSDIHQQQGIHLYDSADQHQGHDLDYHLPQAQYSSSLPPSSSSGMFDHQRENVEFIDNQFSHYYDNTRMANNLTMFPQQCAVASEAPVLGTSSSHSCNIPFSSAPTGLQLEFHFSPDDEEDGSHIEKQPVLPSASFSPPSVADPAVTPDPGGMGIYNGTFPNLSVYDMYVRGGNSDGRCGDNETTQELGNFCVECNTMYKTQCNFHPNEYSYICDTPILTHARLTLPTCLKLGISNIVGHTNNTGVFAKESIAIRTKFGPLIGSSVSCDQLGSTRSFSLWQTFSENSTKVVDTSDENSSNWMMFVKPARLSSEHNLVAFQNGSNVYFVTRIDINPGEELLYWFAKDYARLLGITPNPKNVYYQLCPHCTVCKQIFPDRKQVRSHTRLQHPRPCTKKCGHCSRRFSQVSHLNAHITSVHLKVKKCVCPHCNKRFSDSSNFRKHVRSHSDERYFKCQICGKDFRQKAHLTHHMNTHMPVKNEQCGFCGVRFTRAFTRKQHELQHTKQNKIPCVHCDKVFYKKQVYKQHLKIHNNERNYVCPHCSKAFRTKANLTRHGPSCKQKKNILPLHSLSPQSASSLQAPVNFLHPHHHDITSGQSR